MKSVHRQVEERKNHRKPRPVRSFTVVFVCFTSEEHASCLLLDFLGCGEGDSGGVVILCGNDLLGGPSENVSVPGIDGIIVKLASRGNLSLQIHILLHSVLDLVVSLELGIVLERYVDAARYLIKLTLNVVSQFVARAASELSDALEGFLIEIYSLVNELCAVGENNHSLLEIVIYLRCVVLYLLLKLLEVVLSLYLHKEKYYSGDYTKHPEEYLEYERVPMDFIKNYFSENDVTFIISQLIGAVAATLLLL